MKPAIIYVLLVAITYTICLVFMKDEHKPAVYFRQYSTDKIHYTVIKVKLSEQDSVLLRNDTVFFFKNGSYCSIDPIDLSGLPGGVCFK